MLSRRRCRQRPSQGVGRLFLLTSFLIVAWFVWNLLLPQEEVARTVRIPEGASVEQIGRILEEAGIIGSPRLFRLRAALDGAVRELRAGTYLLRSSQPLREIIAQLREGSSQEVRVTIPEGFTVRDIDALLSRLGLTEYGEIVNCAQQCVFSSFDFLPKATGERGLGKMLEGYLFPETYYVEVESFVPKFFLERMLTEFRRRVVEGLAGDLRSSGRSLHDLVTMASLVEEETRAAEERNIVAGILWKRFDARMGLDVDATVRYALGKPQEALTTGDLEADSPYNTRRYRGLPPGPIAHPGLSSIHAALHPVDSPYWYYLHGRDGVIHYAATNEEHNENKRKYLR